MWFGLFAAIDTEVISDFGCTDADEGTTLTYSLSQAPLNHFRRETTPVARLLVDGKRTLGLVILVFVFILHFMNLH